MAVTFTSNKTGQPQITIGGNDTDRPFPTYSINRQENYSSDDTYLNTSFSITVNGVVVVSGDPTIGGQLHSATHKKAIDILGINDIFPTLGHGILEIESYDGSSTITFDDARLISVGTPAADDASGGFKYQNYSLTFEAKTINGEYAEVPLVSDIQESWDLSVNQDQFAYSEHNIAGSLYKTFTLTHTLSATGNQNVSTSSAVEAWRQAVLWVEKRLQNKPDVTPIGTHINQSSIGPKFVPFYMNTENSKDDLKLNTDEKNGIVWEAYNGNRQISSDIANGSHSVTDTWIIAIQGTTATHTVSIEKSGGQEQAITIVVNGTVQGLNTNTLGGSSSNKNDNWTGAEVGYNAIKPQIRGIAATAYNDINDLAMGPNNSTTLLPDPISRSVSQNKTNGTITWSETYHDLFMLGNTTKIAQQDINVEYKNKNKEEQVIAIIPVIDREYGPVIQKFNTDNIRTTSITVSLVMNKPYKTEEIAYNEAKAIADSYEPAKSWVNSQSYDYTDDYGLITFNKEWYYK